MKEDNYQITIPLKDYKRLKDKEKQLNSLQRELNECFETKYMAMGKPIPIHKHELIKIGKRFLPFYCMNANFVEI